MEKMLKPNQKIKFPKIEVEVMKTIKWAGFSVVYEGISREGRKVALKVEMAQEDERKAGLSREIEVYRKIGKHPSFVELIDFENFDGTKIAVFEYIESPTLDLVIREEGNFDWFRESRITKDLINTSIRLRKKGIYNRDIKGGNIFLADGERVKAFDFGIARFSNEAQKIGKNVFASLDTAAPERIFHDVFDEERSEIYSIASVALAMHVGNAVWRIPKEDPSTTIERKRVQAIEIPDNVPQELAQLYLRATRFDPKERPATFEELFYEIEKVEKKYGKENEIVLEGVINTKVMITVLAASAAGAGFTAYLLANQ